MIIVSNGARDATREHDLHKKFSYSLIKAKVERGVTFLNAAQPQNHLLAQYYEMNANKKCW